MASKAIDSLRGKAIKGTKQCAKDLFAGIAERALRRLLSSDCLRFTMAEAAVRSAAGRLCSPPGEPAQPPAYGPAPDAIRPPFETLKRQIRQLHAECQPGAARVDLPRAGLLQASRGSVFYKTICDL